MLHISKRVVHLYHCNGAETKTENKMTTAQATPFKNFRDALLEIVEVGESINPFGYAYRLCISLRLGTISFEQYDGLCKELKFHCENNKITTSNEIASLF
jgi:hypothetical protein